MRSLIGVTLICTVCDVIKSDCYDFDFIGNTHT